mmetsp:Transcript_8383/g.20844  ORF Transcript_8383/g.20844 Transcript_8383/m.20844 type:complete len:484 (+) Transcript_8383:112-1563(+)
MTDLFTNLICRPPRSVYSPVELGPTSFHLYGTKECFRHDIVLSNRKGNRLQCSMWLPVWIGLDKSDLVQAPNSPPGSPMPNSPMFNSPTSSRTPGTHESLSRAGSDSSTGSVRSPMSATSPGKESRSEYVDSPRQDRRRQRRRKAKAPCVVYLHGNSGSRMDADDMVDLYLERGMVVFAFDFDGSGLSDGEFVTLGHSESQDLACVLDYLGGLPWISGIALHGRSMGACTALKTASSDRYYHMVSGMVLDSCYTSLRQVMRELTSTYAKQVPLLNVDGGMGDGTFDALKNAVVESTIDALRDAVQDRAGFSIDSVDVMADAKHCQCPVLIAHAEQDALVSPSHSRKLAEVYGGPKEAVFFDGDHNSERSLEFSHRSADFLQGCFKNREEELRNARHHFLVPPYVYSFFSALLSMIIGVVKWVRYEEGRVSLRGAVALFVVVFAMTTILEWSLGLVFEPGWMGVESQDHALSKSVARVGWLAWL